MTLSSFLNPHCLALFYPAEKLEQLVSPVRYVPCSRVYHIFRSARFWQGTTARGFFGILRSKCVKPRGLIGTDSAGVAYKAGRDSKVHRTCL